MKAILLTAYGSPDVLQIGEIEKPVPKDNEILVKTRATSVGYGDRLARRLNEITSREFNMPTLFLWMAKLVFGLRRPRIRVLGSEFSGDVEAVGKNVTAFKPGDPVFGYLGQNMGAYAEYLCLPQTAAIERKPANISYEEAAVVPMGAIMAIALLRKVDIKPGQRVLIIGASGGIGSMAVQIAKHYGAHVTGVCGAARREFVKMLGADEALDYARDDWTRHTGRYDLIVDILGKGSFPRAKAALNPNGSYLYVSFKTRQLLQALRGRDSEGKRVVCGMAPGSKSDLTAVRELIEAGKIKPVIGRVFPMTQAADAHRFLESGAHQGHVAITMTQQ